MTITANEMRERDYYGHLHYYYVFDMDLNAHDMRLLMIIQQMQSNPDPKVKPFFSYSWAAGLLGINRRNAIKIAKKLKDKGYIIHKQMEDGKWLWKIPTKIVTGDNPNISDTDIQQLEPELPEIVSHRDTGVVSHRDTPLVSQEDTHKYNNLKANNLNTASCLSSAEPLPENQEMAAQEASKQAFVISEETDRELLRLNQTQPMYAKDNRELLMWCKYNLDSKINADTPDGKLKVLKSWIRNGGLKKPPGYDSPRPGVSAAPEKLENLGYGATSQSHVKRMDEKIETLTWDRVKNQKAPHDVLLAISKDASELAKSHLKSQPRQPGDYVSEQDQIIAVRLSVALKALKHGQVDDINKFKEAVSNYPGYILPQYSGIVALLNLEIANHERSL